MRLTEVNEMSQPPITGNEAIDEALAKVANSGDLDIAEQARLMTEAQVVLQGVLRASREEG